MFTEVTFLFKYGNITTAQFGKIILNTNEIEESTLFLDNIVKMIAEKIINNYLVMKFFPQRVDKISNLLVSILGTSTYQNSDQDRELFYLYIDARKSIHGDRIKYYHNGKQDYVKI